MNKIVPFLFMFWLVVWGASNSFALCPKSLGDAPKIQLGAPTTESEMLVLQQEVNEFISNGEETLRCTGSSMRYNMMLFQIERVAFLYNKKLEGYKSRLATL